MSIAALILAAGTAVLTDQQLAEIGFVERIGHRVELPAGLLNERGQPARLPRGPLLLVPVDYDCANLCGLVLDGVAESLATSELQPPVVVASFDARDGPEQARQARSNLLRRHPDLAARDWQFWSGSSNAVGALAEAMGFRYAFDQERDQFAHEAGLVVLDADHRITRVLTGVRFPSGALQLALQGDSAGGLAERVRLLCYDYDPATGRYTLSILKILKLAGLLTVAFVGLWLWRAHRGRES